METMAGTRTAAVQNRKLSILGSIIHRKKSKSYPHVFGAKLSDGVVSDVFRHHRCQSSWWRPTKTGSRLISWSVISASAMSDNIGSSKVGNPTPENMAGVGLTMCCWKLVLSGNQRSISGCHIELTADSHVLPRVVARGSTNNVSKAHHCIFTVPEIGGCLWYGKSFDPVPQLHYES